MKSNLIRKQNLLAFLLFIVGMVIAVYYLQPPKDLTNDEEVSVQEAVLRHLFENNASSNQQNIAYYFVEISGADPTESLLSRFEEHYPSVLPESNALLSNDLIKEALHKIDGKQGLIFSIRTIKLRKDGKVFVEASYFEASLSSGVYQYLLESKDGNWQIITDKLITIS